MGAPKQVVPLIFGNSLMTPQKARQEVLRRLKDMAAEAPVIWCFDTLDLGFRVSGSGKKPKPKCRAYRVYRV